MQDTQLICKQVSKKTRLQKAYLEYWYERVMRGIVITWHRSSSFV